MTRTLNDLNDLQRSPTPVFAPAPPLPSISTHEFIHQAFGPMNVAAHAQFGYRQIGQFNQTNPIGLPGMMTAPAAMMTPASMSVFRPPPMPLPPPLMTTPGVTSAFHRIPDIATQNQLGFASQFLNANMGAGVLSQMQGQRYGGWVGAGVGTLAGAGLGGGAGAFTGLQIGQAVGDMFGGTLARLPGVSHVMDWMNSEEAQLLSGMAGMQMGTMGNVRLGRRDIGLGGRGMNQMSAMRLGENLLNFSNQQMGGAFNQIDIRNLTQAAGDAGLLDAATNIDQIEGSIKKMMTLVGRLGKLTGDPDFRNNIRELGRMKMMGFEVDQAMDALTSASRYGVMAGMSRGELFQQAQQPAMPRFAAAGLASGLGMTHGAYGAAMGRMQQGIGTAIQQSLMGDVGQRITESNASFLSGHARMALPWLFQAQEGQIGLDPAKLAQLAAGGATNLRELSAQGSDNMRRVAEEIAQQRATAAGRAVRPREVQSILGEMATRQQEWLSEVGMKLGPEGTMRANMGFAAGLMKGYGMEQWEALMTISGNDPMQAMALKNQFTDPKVHERHLAQLDEAIKKERAEARTDAYGRMSAWREKNQRWFGGARDWLRDAFTDEVDAQDRIAARRVALEQQQAADAATGRSQFNYEPLAAGGVYSKTALALQREAIGDRFKNVSGFDTRISGGKIEIGARTELSEGELTLLQRMRGDYGTISGWGERASRWLTRDLMGTGFGGAKDPRDRIRDIQERAELTVGASAAQETGKTLDRVSSLSGKQWLAMDKTMRDQFERWGLSGPENMADLKTQLTAYVNQRGKNAQPTNTRDMVKQVESFLAKRIDPDKARQFVTGNREFVNAFSTMVGLKNADAAGQGSLYEAGTIGSVWEELGVDPGDHAELAKKAHNATLEGLRNIGAIRWGDVDWGLWGKHEIEDSGVEQALATFQDYGEDLLKTQGAAGVMEEKTVMNLVAATYEGNEARTGGDPEKDKNKAQAALQSYLAKGGKGAAERVARAERVVKGMSKGQKQAHARFWRSSSEFGGGTVEGTAEKFVQAAKGEGPLAAYFHETRAAVITKGTRGAGGTIAGDVGEAGGAGDASKAEALEREKKSAEEMFAAWSKDGAITKSFGENVITPFSDAVDRFDKITKRFME